LSKQVKAAEITWDKEAPFSEMHGDFYFSMKNGLEETNYVFLEANHLPDRFAKTDNPAPFIVAETGFGTGLNFLATWASWANYSAPKRPLHFISIEKYPLSQTDLEQSLSNWSELEPFSKQLIEHYPYLIEGQHQVSFDNGLVILTLIFGEANVDFDNYSFIADCWFLDGFSPRKNESMWSENLFSTVARHSDSNTSLSTFTAASSVKKGLIGAGFDINKKPGFGSKREMIYGKFSGKQCNATKDHPAKWSLVESTADQVSSIYSGQSVDEKVTENSFDAIVIGAGLAGVSTASALAEQGLRVAIFDEKPGAMTAASGQTQLAMYAKLPTENNSTFSFITHCLSFSQNFYKFKQATDTKQNFWFQDGLLQLASNAKEQNRQERFLTNIKLPSDFVRHVDAKEASTLSNINILSSALWFKNAGWLEPKAYSRSLLSHANITPFFNCRITSISQHHDTSTWFAKSKNDDFEATYLIVANSNKAKEFEQLKHLPTKPLRGQVSAIKHAALKSTGCVVCGEGYLCPDINSWHHFGATFDLDDNNEDTKSGDNLKNIASIKRWLPGWIDDAESNHLEIKSKAGLRCTTPDYIPIVGMAPKYHEMLNIFAKLRVDAKSCNKLYGHYHKNLYVNIGHGSKGLFSTPPAAALIKTLICGGILPFSENHRTMISPARFIIKHLKRRRI